MLDPKLTPWWAAMGFEIAVLVTSLLFVLEEWLDERSGRAKLK